MCCRIGSYQYQVAIKSTSRRNMFLVLKLNRCVCKEDYTCTVLDLQLYQQKVAGRVNWLLIMIFIGCSYISFAITMTVTYIVINLWLVGDTT